MTLRTDHIAGGLAITAGILLFASSGDLPFGTLSFPGAGLWPKLLCVLLVALGVVLLVGARDSEPFRAIPWSDLRHATSVLAVTAIAIALYTALGFILTMSLLLFALCMIERRSILPAALYSVGVSVATDALFSFVLRSPLERGLLGL
jgi:hypothetical protein